jgi:hypothetical protein
MGPIFAPVPSVYRVGTRQRRRRPASDSWRSGALDPGSAHYFVAPLRRTMKLSELERPLTCAG